MAEHLVILDGSTFFVTDDNGDLSGEEEASGFFYADVRHLSKWLLRINGAPMRLLSARNLEYFSARIFGTLSTARVGENPTVSFQRDRMVSDGLHEDLYIDNNNESEVRLEVELLYAADFADIFEIKERLLRGGKTWVEKDGNSISLMWERRGFRRGTTLEFQTTPQELDENHARFDVTIAPRSRWHLCIDISCVLNEGVRPPMIRCDTQDVGLTLPTTLKEWVQDAPTIDSKWDVLSRTYKQSLNDLASLRFRPSAELTFSLPAAGLPWFMALFGRDSLITAYEVIHFQRRMAHTSLEMLASTQATEYDDYKDSEPGKILHEIRYGKLAKLGEVPHSPYYGSHDSTPLFLILLEELERWTGDAEFARKMEPNARAALDWVRRAADIDGDGYLEYQTRSTKGLVNQCWKDSWNSILFHDGRIAEGPIATCEIQGYAYDARVRSARLAKEVWKDDQLADELLAEAKQLRAQFNKDFWNAKDGYYVLALDGNKQQVDSMTSNMGHLLWSGIVPENRAAKLVANLMSDEMFNGWGIRTMSNRDKGYNPIEYHNGTVWPHDTAIIAEGMRRYGFRNEASRLAVALLEAAEQFSFRLPEVFAGFARKDTEVPVEYPTASRPQAWAAAAPLLALRTLLGLDVVNGLLHDDPFLPEGVGPIRINRLLCRGKRKSVTAR